MRWTWMRGESFSMLGEMLRSDLGLVPKGRTTSVGETLTVRWVKGEREES
jgi:hypothetical protein